MRIRSLQARAYGMLVNLLAQAHDDEPALDVLIIEDAIDDIYRRMTLEERALIDAEYMPRPEPAVPPRQPPESTGGTE